MIRQNRQLVTDVPVEFERYPVEVHKDCRRIPIILEESIEYTFLSKGKPEDVHM